MQWTIKEWISKVVASKRPKGWRSGGKKVQERFGSTEGVGVKGEGGGLESEHGIILLVLVCVEGIVDEGPCDAAGVEGQEEVPVLHVGGEE